VEQETLYKEYLKIAVESHRALRPNTNTPVWRYDDAYVNYASDIAQAVAWAMDGKPSLQEFAHSCKEGVEFRLAHRQRELDRSKAMQALEQDKSCCDFSQTWRKPLCEKCAARRERCLEA
jgi:hypothetical protein